MFVILWGRDGGGGVHSAGALQCGHVLRNIFVLFADLYLRFQEKNLAQLSTNHSGR